MLEWLLRKLFGIKRPPSRKESARKDILHEELSSQSAKGEGMTKDHGLANERQSGERVEPSISHEAVHPPVSQNGALENGLSNGQGAGAKNDLSGPLVADAPLTATAPRETGDTRSAPLSEQIEEEQGGKVHIFNFRAWFYADPVKAALTLGLAFLSWLATYTGMLELIQANTGTMDIGSRIAIGFAVMMLMLMILYLLDSLYSGGTPTWIKPIFVFGYLFLTLISVGFGFGFYWKYLEAQTEATRSAESAVSQVQVALQIGQSRLEQLQSTFTQLTTLSTRKATQERDHGNSCPNSSPGEGPRMRLRDSDSQKFGYAAEYITGRATRVNGDLNALNADLKKVVSRDASTIGADGTRNKFLRALGRKLDLTIARFNTLRTDPQLRQFRDSFDKRAGTTVFPNGRGGTFRCPDVQLQTALRGVVRAIDDIPEIKNPKIAAVEGSEAIIEAFRRLAVTLAALPTLKLPPSPDELRKARKQALSAGRSVVEVSNIDAGLSKRDYIPLSAAVFVDLCILLISLNRRYNNFEKLQRSVASARAGEVGRTVLDIFEAHKNKISQEMLEIFHHAEFEYGRDYYLAVPLIKGSKKALLHARLHAKQDEISRSQHDVLDHKIGILDAKQQKLITERSEFDSMKLQLTNHQNRLLGIQNQLRSNRDQLKLTYRGDLESFARQPDVSDIDTRLKKVTFDKSRCGEELGKLDRLMNGNFARIEQAKIEISALKEQRTNIHKAEERVLQGQLEINAEHDLAKEARFLSNLCISLEANNILHLASVWPPQFQVRAQLKKHNSRYYAKDRHYRVYRFRKVADTQSQMVLDLIMEAARRARENGDYFDTDPVGGKQRQTIAAPLDPQPEPAQQAPVMPNPAAAAAVADRVETDTPAGEKKAEIAEMQDLLASLKQEKAELEALKADVSSQTVKTTEAPAGSQIDREADDAIIVNVREQSAEEIRRLNNALNSSLTGSLGLGVSPDDLAGLGKRGRDDKPASSHKEQSDTAPVLSAAGSEDKTDKTPRKMVKMLGSIFSARDASAPNEEKIIEPELGPGPVEEPDAVLEHDIEPELKQEPDIAVSSEAPEEKPASDKATLVHEDKKPAPEEEKAAPEKPVEEEPLVAIRPDPVPSDPVPSSMAATLASKQINPPRDRRANEESLLPPKPDESGPSPALPSFEQEQAANVSTDPVLARLSELKESLKQREQNQAQKLAGTSDSLPGERKQLTDPVILGPGEASQDHSPPPTAWNADLRIAHDEPSEADNFEEGKIPGFLKGDDLLDEASDTLEAQSWAKRLSPNSDKT